MRVQVGKFGTEAEDVRLDEGATVGEALKKMGISHNGERILVNGKEADIDDEVESGDVVNLVTPKQAG